MRWPGSLTSEKVRGSLVYMPDQFPELAAAMVERYKNEPNREPICFIGHSWGGFFGEHIAGGSKKSGVRVTLIICMDSVDASVVPKNVKACYNFWMPGFSYGYNISRGIPMEAEPGSPGVVYNFNLTEKEGEQWHDFMMHHGDMDKHPEVAESILWI